MSSIIAELVDDFNHLGQKERIGIPKDTLARASYERHDAVNIKVAEGDRDVRLPWTHRKDGDDFHSL